MWTGFQTRPRISERGFNEKSIPPQRTGPVKKERPILANTHEKPLHTPPDRLLSNEAAASPFLSFYLQRSVSHAGSRVNQLQSRSSLSEPELDMNPVLTSRPASGWSLLQSGRISPSAVAEGWLTYFHVCSQH